MGDQAMHVVFDSAELTIQVLVAKLRQQAVQSVVQFLSLTPCTPSLYALPLQIPQVGQSFFSQTFHPGDEGCSSQARISP